VKLYASLTSPYARKVRIALREKALTWELCVTDPQKAESPVPALNPLGKVPVLTTDDGMVFFDSPLILEWLDSRAEPLLVPASGEDRWQVLQWQALADGVMDACVARLIESRRPAEHVFDKAIRRQEHKVDAALRHAEERVTNDHLVAGRLSLADIALLTAVEYVDLRYPNPWRDMLLKLSAWHERMCERPSFVETRPPTG
jgi:glutathione S-transferase